MSGSRSSTRTWPAATSSRCSRSSPAGGSATAEIVLEAVAADRHSAAILEVPAGAPLLMLERLTRLDDGRPVDLEFVRFRGDRITMRGNVRRTPEEEINP